MHALRYGFRGRRLLYPTRATAQRNGWTNLLFFCLCQNCKKIIDRAMIEYERKVHDDDTRIC